MKVPIRMPVLMLMLIRGPKIDMSCPGTVLMTKEVPATWSTPTLKPKISLPMQIAKIFSIIDTPTPTMPIKFASKIDLRLPSEPVMEIAPNEPNASPTAGMPVIMAASKLDC